MESGKNSIDIIAELNDITNDFLGKINKFRERNFIDGNGLILLNLSKEDEIKITFAINYYKLKPIHRP